MTPAYLVYAVGFLYVLLFAGLSLLRRERFSPQFVFEGLCLTGIVFAAVRWGGVSFHPVYFLILLYALTMRVRLLIELGNLLSGWRRYPQAMALYQLAQRLVPDRSSRLMTAINVGATYLKLGMPEKTIEVLKGEKEHIFRQLGPKYAAGCSYNLGMAYRRCKRYDEALRHFHEVGEAFPLSHFAALAGKAAVDTRVEAGLAPPAPGEA
jgi:tetratricopeptide (TPR) repeat protein